MRTRAPSAQLRAGAEQEPGSAISAAGRRRILDAARSALVEHGYRGLDLGAVARAARVPAAVLHRDFPRRSSLVKALVEHDLEIFLSRLTSGVPLDEGLDVMVIAGLNVFFDFVGERREEYRILFGDAGRFDPSVAALLRELRERLATIYLKLFRPAVEAEGVEWPSDAEARLTAHAVISMAEGGALAWASEERLERDSVVEVLARMIRQSLLSATHGAPSGGRPPHSTVRKEDTAKRETAQRTHRPPHTLTSFAAQTA